MPTEYYIDLERFARILMPYADRLRKELGRDPRLVYYTKASTAEQLIRKQELWFRDSSLMNDSREVRHGVELLENFFADPAKRAVFCDAIDSRHPGASAEILQMFEVWKTSRAAETYLMSLSLHAPKDLSPELDEDKHGRLSMWRGYGGPEGVALVFNIPMGIEVQNLKLFFSPVGYFNEVDSHISGIIKTLEAEKEFLAGVPQKMMVNGAFIMLVMAAVSLKHPGFYEEREWRLLCLPSTYRSDYVKPRRVQINGVNEETVFTTTFPALANGGMPGMDLNLLIDRIIVGPTEEPDKIKQRMVQALEDAGIPDADKRVIISGIPFRFPKKA